MRHIVPEDVIVWLSLVYFRTMWLDRDEYAS